MKRKLTLTDRAIRLVSKVKSLQGFGIVVATITFGVIGSILLYQSFAAGQWESLQPETGTRSGNLAVVADAGASNGSYIRFGGSTATFTRFEAESAQHNVQVVALTGTSGNQVLGYFYQTGQYVTFSVNAPSAGSYALRLRYNAALNETGQASAMTRAMQVNNQTVGTPSFNLTTMTLNNWGDATTYQTKDLGTVNLNQGSNTITFRIDDAGSAYPWDVDYLEVASASTPTNPPPPPPPGPNPPPPPPPGPNPPPPPPPTPTGKRCFISLHGKSGSGSGSYDSNGVTNIFPSGNAPGWGGLQWLYFPESGYQEVLNIVTNAAVSNGCDKVVLHGFSNGGAAAAKIYCRGANLGGRLVGVIVDDPVPDHGVDNCSPASGVNVKVYYSGWISGTVSGWGGACLDDWTCEGGTYTEPQPYGGLIGATMNYSGGDHSAAVTESDYSGWW